jgi:hypothetical protein
MREKPKNPSSRHRADGVELLHLGDNILIQD